jgi:hypothetical protein
VEVSVFSVSAVAFVLGGILTVGAGLMLPTCIVLYLEITIIISTIVLSVKKRMTLG